MSWVKLDDSAPDDPRFLKLDRSTRLLHVEALAWASRHQTGGTIPAGSLARLTDESDPDAAAGRLVAAGLWAATGDGFRVVWLQDDQPSPEEVARRRQWNRTKQERHRRHVTGDHAMCAPKWCKSASRNPVTNPVSNSTPSRPVRLPTVDRTGKDGDAAAVGTAAVPDVDVIPATRRELGRFIRDTNEPSLRKVYLDIFEKTYGSLYRGQAA